MKWFNWENTSRLFSPKNGTSRYEAIPLTIGEDVGDGVEGQDVDGLDAEKHTTQHNLSGPWTTAAAFQTLLAVLGHAWLALRPRLLTPSQSQEKELSSTDWLNGVRGVASLFVFFSHIRGYLYPGP